MARILRWKSSPNGLKKINKNMHRKIGDYRFEIGGFDTSRFRTNANVCKLLHKRNDE